MSSNNIVSKTPSSSQQQQKSTNENLLLNGSKPTNSDSSGFENDISHKRINSFRSKYFHVANKNFGAHNNKNKVFNKSSPPSASPSPSFLKKNFASNDNKNEISSETFSITFPQQQVINLHPVNQPQPLINSNQLSSNISTSLTSPIKSSSSSVPVLRQSFRVKNNVLNNYENQRVQKVLETEMKQASQQKSNKNGLNLDSEPPFKLNNVDQQRSLKLNQDGSIFDQSRQPNYYDNINSIWNKNDQQQASPKQQRKSKQQTSSKILNSPPLSDRQFMFQNSIQNQCTTSDANTNQQYGQIMTSAKNYFLNEQATSKENNKLISNQKPNNDDSSDSVCQKFQWIEIYEPKSQTKMFANLTSGECRWTEPKGVYILSASNPNITQWWELYDQKTQRFYYFSVKNSKTIWQKPTSSDAIVVPLAKLQIMKQNTKENQDSSFDQFLSNRSQNVEEFDNSSTETDQLKKSRCTCGYEQRSNNYKQKLVNSSTQTMIQMAKPIMVSRWTQTTTQTLINDIKLDDQHHFVNGDFRRQQPSLKHYLLSEARFARAGQNHQKSSFKQESFYDPVAAESFDYANEDYEDDDDEEVVIDDDDSDFSCDADDEYDLEEYDEDEVDDVENDEADGFDEEELDDSNSELDTEKQNQRYQQPIYADYDTVDYSDYICLSPKKSPSSHRIQQPPSSSPPKKDQQNLDGIRMSASFTAVDFKRSALGRSSYTPLMQHQHSYNQQQQQNQPLNAYSNPFNNTGSLRSSTGRISSAITSAANNCNNNFKNVSKPTMSNIADRINLFNKKVVPQNVSLDADTSLLQKNFYIQPLNEVDKNSKNSSFLTNNINNKNYQTARRSTNESSNVGIQRYIQNRPPESSLNQLYQNTPSKSTSLTSISSPNFSNIANQQLPQKNNQSIPINVVPSEVNSSFGSFNSSKNVSENQSVITGCDVEKFDSSIKHSNFANKYVLSSNKSFESNVELDQSQLSVNLVPNFANTGSLRQQKFLNFDDAHAVMINKTTKSFQIDQNNEKPASKGSKKDKKKNEEKPINQSKQINAKKSLVLPGNKKKNARLGRDIKENTPLNNGNVSIESFARECVSRHRKGGIFSKKKTLKSMLVHTKKPLKKPMISTISDSILVKESVLCFKLIQIFMLDRVPSPAGSNDLSWNQQSNPIPSDEQILVRLINVCVQMLPLRDEVLVQVARQVTQNPSPESERRGLELMCVLFWYFTASNKLESHLHAFLSNHRNIFTNIVRRKFEQQIHRSRYTHSHLFYRKPHSIEEVAKVLRCVRAGHVGVFGESLADAAIVFGTSQKKEEKSLPWPIVLLTEALLEPRHEDREGVFRCVGDMDDVHRLKMKLDTILVNDPCFEEQSRLSSSIAKPRLTDDHDMHVISSTFKLYFRELREALIPMEMYLEALDCAHSTSKACTLLEKLPPINRFSLIYLIKFLQIFSTPEQVKDTKMDDANLSMVWAPNILRSPLSITSSSANINSSTLAALNSANIYEHTRAEMSLVRTLIQHFDTSNWFTDLRK